MKKENQFKQMSVEEFYEKFGDGKWSSGDERRKLADITHLSYRCKSNSCYNKNETLFIIPKNKMEFLVRLANRAIKQKLTRKEKNHD